MGKLREEIVDETKQSPAQLRSAHAAIKGYEYQFDRTILELLAASATAVVHIEGIEDVDVFDAASTKVTQIKYYEAQRYASPKSLRDPIALMLDHFRTGARLQYVLHVHFEEPGALPASLTLEQAKTCLTRRDRTLGIDVHHFAGMNDSDLQDFCDRVSIRSGMDFAAQEAQLVGNLVSVLGCSHDEVLAIYLAKARDFVHEKARAADSKARRVTRASLIEFLSVRELLFSRWQLAAVGHERFIRAQVRHLKQRGFTDTRKVRGLSVGLSDENLASTIEIVRLLAGSHLGRLKSAKPWVVVLTGTSDLVDVLKTEMIRSGLDFNDGYESIDFSPSAFAKPPVINLSGASDKVKSSSFVLRIVTESNFLAYIADADKLARLVSIGNKPTWHATAAEDTYVLKDYEPGILQALMGAVA